MILNRLACSLSSSQEILLTRDSLVRYAGASGDYNPVHTDNEFVTKVAGYPGVFAHGMLTMGLTGRMLTDYVGVGNLTRYGVRFTRQVFPGDTLTATATDDGNGDPKRVLSVSTTFVLNVRADNVAPVIAYLEIGRAHV